MEVKIKKLHEDAIIPKYACANDAGLDLTAVSYEYDEKMDAHIYGTGLAIEIPQGYVGLLFPRSSNRKTDGYMTNHVGVIDSGYRGEIMITFKLRDTLPADAFKQMYTPYHNGDRIAQLIIMPYPAIELVEVDELSSSERGEGGHGHTGKLLVGIMARMRASGVYQANKECFMAYNSIRTAEYLIKQVIKNNNSKSKQNEKLR